MVRMGAVLTCAVLLTAACSSGTQGGSSASNQTATSAPAFVTTASWGPASWTYNFFGPGRFAGSGTLLSLGFPHTSSGRMYTPGKHDLFYVIPQLYTSYSETTSQITVHLVPRMKFSDGEPLNAQDVVDSILVAGLNPANVAFDTDVTGATAINPTTVEIDFVPGKVNLGWMLAIVPLPMSQYGQFLSPAIEQDIWSYTKLIQNPSTAATAQSSSAYKAIDADYVTLLHFQPKQVIGDGPFMLTGVSTGSAVEVKSPTYFDASKVHVQKMTIINVVSGGNVFPLLYSHDVDWYANAAPSATEYDQWLGTSGGRTKSANADQTEEVLFNNKKYPFTLTPVRQAMAYLINRKTLLETEDGGKLVGNEPDQVPDGLGGFLNSLWLSPAHLHELNPYKYSVSKATQLLGSAGFRKTGGQWVMPNGQPFTTTVIASSASSGPLFAKELASMLSTFGIQASASTVNPTAYNDQITKGQFDIGWWNQGVHGNLGPMCAFLVDGLGGSLNYTYQKTGAYNAGEPGIGFGPTYDVPGLGNVQVSSTISDECQNAGTQAGALAWEWAQVVNSQVPFLTYGDTYNVILYSNSHYSWPAPSDPIWQEAGIYPYQALMLMIERGMIRAK